MRESIFDLIDEPVSEGKEGYFELAKKAPQPKDNSFFNSVKDYTKTIVKGTVEGISRFGRMMGGTIEDPNILEKQTESLDQLLPTDEGYTQRAIRHGLREAPTMASFPGSATSNLSRSMLAGFMGEGAKDLGLPEWAQSAAEITAYIGPDITKKLLEKGSNKEIIEFAKKKGMTDEQITPLIQSEFKQKWLSKLSPKRGMTQSKLKDTKSKLDEVYGNLHKSESAGLEISEKANGELINDLFKKTNEIPFKVRKEIEKDLSDLLENKITGSSIINFWSDINHNLASNTKQLSLLKEPLKKALNSISPELAKEFEMTNQLYTKYYPIASKLKPNLTSDIISAGEALGLGFGLVGAVTMGHTSTLYGLLGEKAGKELARQLLLNPRLQQLSEKMVKALNENKYGVAKKLTEAFSNTLRAFSPEVSEELDKVSEEDFKKFLEKHHSTKKS